MSSGGGPREKMINLMYLVLTAMLAMNVSSSVLEQFISINNSFELTAKSSRDAIAQEMKRFEKMVSDVGNKDKDVELLNKANKCVEEAVSVVDYIETVKNEMINRVGGYDKNGRIKDAKNDAVVVACMLKEERAVAVQNKVNGFMKYLTDISEKEYKPIALDAWDSPFYKDDPNQKEKNYGFLNFGDHTPISAALARLSDHENQIMLALTDVIGGFSKKVGIDQLKFDVLRTIVNSDSNVVPAGMNYEAALYLAASSSSVVSEMFVNGKPIKVDSSGVGRILLPTPVNLKYDNEGFAVQKFDTVIKQKNPATGNVVTISDSYQYKIAKPILDVQSASVAALYRRAGNELVIKCPNLGTFYNPRFKIVEGKGQIMTDKVSRNNVVIVPEGKSITVRVSNHVENGGEIFIGDLKYNVRAIPKPQLYIYADGKAIDERVGISTNCRKVGIKIVPDEGFSAFLPKDSVYKVESWKFMICKGSGALAVIDGKSDTISLVDKMHLLAQADRVVFEIDKVVRYNYNNEKENVYGEGVIIFRNVPINRMK